MRSPTPSFEAAAVAVQRLAVLLDAGLAPVSAWTHVAAAASQASDVSRGSAGAGEAGTVPHRVVDGLLAAHDIPERLRRAAVEAPPAEVSAWVAVAVVWAVATRAGAPLAPTLGRLAEVLRSLGQSARDIEVALAGPMATSRIVLALPLVGLGLGMLLGFDIFPVLITPPGIMCVVVGGGLVATGLAWNRRLVASARTRDATPGLSYELVAIALGGGSSVEGARRLVDEVYEEVTQDVAASGASRRRDATPGSTVPLDDVDAVLSFARSAGVPVAALLRAEAEGCRRAARSDAARRAAELESRLLLPLGLCVLPAFVALGVAPIALAILSTTALPV
ncbi:MAG TPA: hypothetical protein VNT53_02740 [Pseudolysinimonas sp.]|nr:hypothetical protein [Pseudolysinimonas sp.]